MAFSPRLSPRSLVAAGSALATLGLVLSAPAATATAGVPRVPRFSHVVEVFLENEGAASTWEASSFPGIQAVKATGAYIPQFYGVGHASLSNYEAAFGGAEPTTQGKADCAGQPYGSCIFPARVPTIATMLDAAHKTWKVYSEGMTGAPLGHNCLHAVDRKLPDFYQGPFTNGYATRHNPAAWFDSILTKGGSEKYCQDHSVDLSTLDHDLQSSATLPTFSFVVPDTCHDGHDTASIGGCTADPEGPGAPAGVAAIDAWLPGFVQQVTTSPAWDRHSLLIIATDEAATSDASGCRPCHDTSAGGRIGAVVISPMIKPGTTSTWNGDHYGVLRTIEASLRLPTLKSKAATPDAAAAVHDGDPGVVPLTDVWFNRP
ncbi:MAG: alkaline phosphatase family protein [Acidimicrobiales bacterium]